ncbi:MAG: chemotaxis protein CheA [Nitrospinaceae bacterium]
MDDSIAGGENPTFPEGDQPLAPNPTGNSSAGSDSPKDNDDDDGMNAVVNEFLIESYENLDQLDRDLVDLEQNPTEQSLLASIFRTIHTIKGTCGFIGFNKLESVAHVGENLLSKLRDGELTLNPPLTSALLAMVDAVRQMLSCIEKDKNEGNVDYSDLMDTLTRLQKGETVVSVPISAGTPDSASTYLEEIPEKSTEPAQPEPVSDSVEELPEKKVDRRKGSPLQDMDYIAEHGERRKSVDRRTDSRSAADSNIRVDVSLLDQLMNLVGELVLARNQILQFTLKEHDPTFVATTQHLNLVTTELQAGVMKTRMQPIGNIWNKFPRVVRDLSMSIGKKIRLEMEGKETELDKTLIEAIKDPLTHIVRNSVDHGVESPEVRRERGKPEEGVLKLRAFHEGGQVNIEIIDDGGGIDPEKIKAKGLEKNLITQEQASRMSDRELVNLVFAPGFSTAGKVTNVSGRGVGMDLVKTNIEKIGGTVDIQSRVGEGTTLKVKIPLTLAIIPALIVMNGKNRFAIPQVNLLELLRLEEEQAKTAIETIQGAPVYRLRGHLLPLVYMNEVLKIEKSKESSGVINIVVLQADNRQFGLVVEGIADTEEIVVKPLGKQLKDIPAFAGATIMGDGKVALILDVMGLAQEARVVSQGREKRLAETAGAAPTDGDRQTLLILKIGELGRMAIPLSAVARLEVFERKNVERSGGTDVVQYRGEIMPLIYLSEVLNGGGSKPASQEDGRSESEKMQTVVYTHEGKSVGLVVDQILDIVEETITVKRSLTRKGVMATVVVQDKVTDVLDVEGIVKESDGGF